MNNLDATVVRVVSRGWDDEYTVFRVKVVYNCWGRESETEIWCSTLEKAEKIKEGMVIQV